MTIRKYRAGDEVEINRAFNEVFGAARPLDEWHWKFRRNPTNAMMIAVAESAGKIVGQYADMTAFFQYRDKVVPVANAVDNFVHPQLRAKGVQQALFKIQDQLWSAVFGFGFPNRAAYVVGKRILKYQDVGKMPVLFKRLNFRLAARRRAPWLPRFLLELIGLASNAGYRMRVRARPSPAVTTRMVDSFDERIDELWDRVRKRHRIVCVRDRRYLEWRYSKPGAGYRIAIAEKGDVLAGYAITSMKEEAGARAGHIVDVVTDDSPETDAALLKCATLDLLSGRADYALCWMLPDKGVFQSLRRFGFAQKEDVFPPVNIVSHILVPGAVDKKVLKDSKNWYLTMGDSDVF